MAGSGDSYDESTRQIGAAELRRHLGGGEEARALVTCVSEPRLGRSFPLKPGRNIIGRALDADIALPAPTISRQHAEIVVTEGRCALADSGSTNGTVCNGEPVTTPVPLTHGSRIVLGGDVILVFSVEDAIEHRMRSKLYEMATRDPLTNAYNRRFFSERLDSEWPWAVRHAQSCALIALDLHGKYICSVASAEPVGIDDVDHYLARRVADVLYQHAVGRLHTRAHAAHRHLVAGRVHLDCKPCDGLSHCRDHPRRPCQHEHARAAVRPNESLPGDVPDRRAD